MEERQQAELGSAMERGPKQVGGLWQEQVYEFHHNRTLLINVSN